MWKRDLLKVEKANCECFGWELALCYTGFSFFPLICLINSGYALINQIANS
jgi:hypothetical protein